MSELERQLTRALKELSAQYEREQKRQAGLIEDLAEQLQQVASSQQDIEDRLNGLASDYEQLAADYKRIVDGLGRR